ncbi:MAG: hypothetical protein GX446_18540 [Chthonomonadales bacterium]|nr:hypothetical protein [Chthonomonadales bacterium]
MQRHLCWAAGLAAALALSGCGGGSGDHIAPVVASVSAVRDSANVPQVTATVTDVDSGVSTVTAVVTQVTMGAPGAPIPLDDRGSGAYAGALPTTATRFYVQAVDRAGNSARSAEMLIPPPDPGL